MLRAHAKAKIDGLEDFLLFAEWNRGCATAMLGGRTVRAQIHQPDNAVIHAAGQVGRQIGKFVFLAEGWNTRRPAAGSARCENPARWRRLRNKDPDEAIIFFACVTAGVDAIDLSF